MPNLHVKPGPPLSRFVELLWYYENAPQPHQKERLMPDGCTTLIINLLEDEIRLYDPDDTKKVRKFAGAASAVRTQYVLRSTPMNRLRRRRVVSSGRRAALSEISQRRTAQPARCIG